MNSRPHAVRVPLLALLALSALSACGIDEHASLGRFAQADLPLAGSGTAGQGPSPDARPEPPPPPPFDAGGVEPPQVPEPLPDASVSPPASGMCVARAYLADFTCTLTANTVGPFPSQPGGMRPPPPPPPMMTSIAFGLQPSADGAVASVVDSAFEFLAWDVAFTGRLEGQLDCATGRFDAIIADGMTGAVFVPAPTTFVGALAGMVVDPASGSMVGTWWHAPSEAMSGCTGDWIATPRP